MASIPSLGSTTAESALHELLTFLNNKQNDATANPQNIEIISAFSRDNRTGNITATLNFQSTSTIANDGSQNVVVTEVFS